MPTELFQTSPSSGRAPSWPLVMPELPPLTAVVAQGPNYHPRGGSTVQMTLGGHPVTVVPLGSPGSKGQTLYDVQWRGVAVQTAFTGQIGPEQFKTGSPLLSRQHYS